MLTKLTNTDAREIAAALVAGERTGRSGSGQVLTLIVDAEAAAADKVRLDALEAGRLHPSRVLLIVRDPLAEHRSEADGDEHSGIDAEILNGEDLPGEMVTLWLSGEAEQHAASVVRPLLLPELPVVIWWTGEPPTDPNNHELAKLTRRQILESGLADDQLQTLTQLAKAHRPGQTDLSWTRITRWRALLVAMLDHFGTQVQSAVIKAPRQLAAAALLRAWLQLKLQVDVDWQDDEGPGLHSVRFHTAAGDLALTRKNDTQGVVEAPGREPVVVALARKRTRELIGDELAQLGGDRMLDAVLAQLAESELRS